MQEKGARRWIVTSALCTLGVFFVGTPVALVSGCSLGNTAPRSAAMRIETNSFSKVSERAPGPTYRGRAGNADLYLPSHFAPKDGRYDVVVHFHGIGSAQEANAERVGLNAAVVSVNLGVGTSAYGAAFRDPASFDRLLAATEAEIERSGRLPLDGPNRNARIGRVALTAWSAGASSVSEILSVPDSAKRVDAVLLADGLYTSFTDLKKRTVKRGPLEKYAELALLAEKDQRLFAITHTAIPTVDYPSMDETVSVLLQMRNLDKRPDPRFGPRGLREIYEAHRGSFHVWGFEGVTAKDHIDQIHAMGDTVLPLLVSRWTAARTR